MPWWGWIVIGAVLMGSEMFVATDFYLAVLGAAALSLGLIGSTGLELPVWGQWGTFGVLSVLYLVVFRRRIYQRFGPSGEDTESIVGEVATMQERIEAGRQGRAELRGSVWTVENTGDGPLEEGERARVEGVTGLTLSVRAETGS